VLAPLRVRWSRPEFSLSDTRQDAGAVAGPIVAAISRARRAWPNNSTKEHGDQESPIGPSAPSDSGCSLPSLRPVLASLHRPLAYRQLGDGLSKAIQCRLNCRYRSCPARGTGRSPQASALRVGRKNHWNWTPLFAAFPCRRR
jgi:hypothetical protein